LLQNHGELPSCGFRGALIVSVDYSVKSTTDALAAFFWTDATPFLALALVS
jgi:hypothetical protein